MSYICCFIYGGWIVWAGKSSNFYTAFFQKQENQPEEEKSSVSQDKSEDESGKIVFKVKCHHDSMIPTIKKHMKPLPDIIIF